MKTFYKNVLSIFFSSFFVLNSFYVVAEENDIIDDNNNSLNEIESNNYENMESNSNYDSEEELNIQSNNDAVTNKEDTIIKAWDIKPYAGMTIFPEFIIFNKDASNYSSLNIFYRGFLGTKFEYEFPELEEILKGDLKILVKSSGLTSSEIKKVLPGKIDPNDLFLVELKQAYVELAFVKLGIGSSTFNSEKKGIPQVKFFYEYETNAHNFNLEFAAEFTNSNNYLIRINQINSYNFEQIRLPIAIIPKVSYSFSDKFDLELAGLGKLLVTSIEDTSGNSKEKKDKAYIDTQILGGFNLITKIKPFNKTELKLGFMFGKGIGYHMSDWTSSFISKKECSTLQVETDVNNKTIKDKGGPVTLWGFRSVLSISQQLSRSFKFYFDYMMDSAGKEIGKMFKPRKDEKDLLSSEDNKNNGYEKWHKFQAFIEWNVVGADIVKIMLGSKLFPFEKDKLMSIFMKLSYDLNK